MWSVRLSGREGTVYVVRRPSAPRGPLPCSQSADPAYLGLQEDVSGSIGGSPVGAYRAVRRLVEGQARSVRALWT